MSSLYYFNLSLIYEYVYNIYIYSLFIFSINYVLFYSIIYLTYYKYYCTKQELIETMTYLSMDIVSQSIFQYPLKALNGSSEGSSLHKCLLVLSEHMAGQGIYANPKVRKYTPQEITAVTTDWRNFITKLTKNAQAITEEYKTKHNDLDHMNNFNHALIHLANKNPKVGFR